MDDMRFCRHPRPSKIGLHGGFEFEKLFKERLKTVARRGLNPQLTTLNPMASLKECTKS